MMNMICIDIIENYYHILLLTGMSAPGGHIYKHFGFTEQNLTARAREVIQFYRSSPTGAPSLVIRPKFPQILGSH